MSTYTEKELQVIDVLYVAFNYGTADAEIDDNASAISVKEIAQVSGLGVATVKGVTGSLCKKGLLEPWDDDMLEYTLHVTEKGIRAYYERNGEQS